MKILVIGCGYLGRRVAQRWLAAGYSVSALTRSTANAQKLTASRITPILGDITDPSSLEKLPPADLILYAVGFDPSAGQDRQSVVLGGLQNTLQALSQTVAGPKGVQPLAPQIERPPQDDNPQLTPLSLGRGAGGKGTELTPLPHLHSPRLIFISTTSVYGQTAGEWVDETSPTEPETDSARIALAVEQLVSSHTIPQFTILRLSGIYGPGRLLRRIEQLRAGEPMSGSGDAWLNLIHVDDAATAVTLATERLIANESIDRETFLISDDRPVLRRDYYTTLAELTHSPPPTFDPSLPSRIQGTGKRCRNTLTKQRLDWSPRFPTWIEGLKDSVARQDDT